MPKNPVTVSHFNPKLAAATRNKAIEIAHGSTDRLVMLKPDVYVVMNSATHSTAEPMVIRRLRAEGK